MWEVLSNEDPGNQVRTTELSELSPFQRFSMLTPSGHGESDFAGLSTDPRPVPQLPCQATKPTLSVFARLKSSRSSRNKSRSDASTRRFSGLKRSLS